MDYDIGFLNFHCMSHSHWVPDELTLIPLLPTNSYDENAESEVKPEEDFVNIDDIRNVEIKRQVKEEEDSVTVSNDYYLISSNSWIPEEKIPPPPLPSPLLPTPTLTIHEQNAVSGLETEEGPVVMTNQQKVKCLCVVCAKLFVTTDEFMQHIQSHSKPYQCCLCNESIEVNKFSFGVRALLRHSNIHLGIKETYQCEECNQSFPSLSKLITHHKKTHPLDEKFQCDYCTGCFLHIKILRKQKKIHRIKKNFQCQYCLKFACNKQPAVKIEKTIKCPACNYTFQNTVQRTCHIQKIHPDVKPFLCIICDEGFLNKKTLNIHKKTHGQTYTCLTCSKKFKYRYRLMRHSQIHTGKKLPNMSNVTNVLNSLTGGTSS